MVIGCLAILAWLFVGPASLAQDSSHITPEDNKQTSYVESNDAIGVRIVPNPEHYSISRWYKNQGFSGSPQSLTVDGYEAIRDGRTVYVNAANVKADASNPGQQLVYTNIYLISYNQDPSTKTIDILGQIVKNWKFNTDLQEKNVYPATCSISTRTCSSDADCGSAEFCAPSSASQSNTCQLKEIKNCFFDTDCPKGFFCDSVKAKIIRDVKRVGQAVEISEALMKYQSAFGSYPKLSAGSYLPGQSLSLWPSWSNNFLKELSLPASLIDPINTLGYCPGFDKETCWNASSSRFYQSSGSSSGNTLILPASSYAYAYKSSDGQSFNFCSTLETAENKVGLNFRFSPPVSNTGNCIVDGVPNTAPRLISSQLQGEASREFAGWVEFIDDQDNILSWNMNLVGSNWGSSWPLIKPVLQNTNNPNQKKIYSPLAGVPGTYQIKLDVSDGQMTTTKYLDIIVSNTKPFIEAENITYRLHPDHPFTYSFYFSDDSLSNYQTAYQVTKISGTNSSFDPLLSNSKDLKKVIEQAGPNRYKVSYEYKIPTSFKFSQFEEYKYRIKVTDRYSGSSEKDIVININNDLPSLEFSCLSEARLGGKYSCLIGPKKQLGAGNQELSYSFDANFTNLSFDYGSSPDSVFLRADNTFSRNDSNSGLIKIRVTNEYGASSEKSFNLKINTYCGDGVKQSTSPNGERRGGIYNDGYEDCDGLDGVATGTDANKRVASSGIDRQYACATFNSDTPYPIPNNGYCVFKSSVSGGGFCGDGYCQVKDSNGVNLENFENCPGDCLHLCKPSCAGKQCGSDGCGGSCGSCTVIGEDCYGGQCCTAEGTVSVFLFDDPVILGGEEGSPSIFFNNKKYKLEYSSQGTYSTKVPIDHDKNVLALEAQIENLNNGVNVSLNHCSQQLISPSDINNVKCTNTIEEASEVSWFEKNYDDSKWPKANINFSNGRPAIWANDYDSSHRRLINAYCRYSFTGDNFNKVSCIPDPSNKNCGANPCGSNYRPNDCLAGGNEGDFYCNEATNTCSCNNKTCADFGDTSGKEGSVCGQIDNGCGGTLDCGNSPVDPGLYCVTPDRREYSACNLDKPVNTYQKKCWYTIFERSVTVRQGDVPEKTKCDVKRVEDPECSSYSDPACPTQCSTKTLISSGLKGDSCWSQGFIFKKWTPRKEWKCSTETVKKIWYYGDTCFPDTGDRVRNNGTCGSCRPDCHDKKCGDSDGCGGNCQVNSCGDNERCSNGVCVSCSCQDTACGETNPCGNVCLSEGNCEAGKTCQNGSCVSSVPVCNCVGTSDLVGDCSALRVEDPAECTAYEGCYCQTGDGPVCGDGTCDSSEDCSSCSGDCGSCPCDAQSLCYNLGKSGTVGGACGIIKPESCSEEIDCGVFPQEGNYCKLPAAQSTQQYLNEIGAYNSNWEFINRGCNPNAPDNTYQKKCWYNIITRSLTLRQGDKAQADRCALEYSVEDPVCSLNTEPACPADCPTRTYNGEIDGDSCIFWKKNIFGVAVDDWAKRQKWTCSYSSSERLWYYGEKCSSYETINNTGKCSTCTPNCTNKTCGQSDGCGGTCTKCGLYQACVSGTCKYATKVRLSVDDEYQFYLLDSNNNYLAQGSGKSWTIIGEHVAMLNSGNYVLAVKAHNVQKGAGIAAAVETGLKEISTDDNDVWKCTSVAASAYGVWSPASCTAGQSVNWMTYGFNDTCSSWKTAKNMGNAGPNDVGNMLPYRQIWDKDDKAADVACRLKFTLP